MRESDIEQNDMEEFNALANQSIAILDTIIKPDDEGVADSKKALKFIIHSR